jgi:hypothetical protein
MFDEQPDGDPHGECAAEIHRLREALTNLVNTFHEGRAVPQDSRSEGYVMAAVEAAEDAIDRPKCACSVAGVTHWECNAGCKEARTLGVTAAPAPQRCATERDCEWHPWCRSGKCWKALGAGQPAEGNAGVPVVCERCGAIEANGEAHGPRCPTRGVGVLDDRVVRTPDPHK